MNLRRKSMESSSVAPVSDEAAKSKAALPYVLSQMLPNPIGIRMAIIQDLGTNVGMVQPPTGEQLSKIPSTQSD